MKHLEEFRRALDGRNRAAGTIRGYIGAVEDFARRMEVDDEDAVTAAMLDRYLGRLSMEGQAAASRRARANGLRAYFDFCFERGLIPANPAKTFRGPSEKRGDIPTFTRAEVELLIWGCPRRALTRGAREPEMIFARRRRVADYVFARDTALLALTYSLGLRAEEVGKLRVTDVQFDAQGRATISVMGKWARQPTKMRLDRRVQRELENFMRVHGDHPALFPPADGTVAPERRAGVSPDEVAKLLARRVELAGIKPRGRRISPHILRYSVANHLYKNGRGLDIYAISAFLRHRDIKTTERYLQAWAQENVTARAAVFLPWNPRGRAISQGAQLA